MEGRTPPELVREILLLMAVALSPVVLLAAVIAGLTLVVRLRRPSSTRRPGHKPAKLRTPEAIRVMRRMRRNAGPTLLLAPGDAASASKMGGEPDLPIGMPWPEGPEGPLRFVCQIDLAPAQAAGAPDWLPPDGRLLAFHDERYGAVDQVRVFYVAAGAELAPAAPVGNSAWPYVERSVAFVAEQSLPSLDWLDEDVASLDVEDDELDVLANPVATVEDVPRHRIAGYPEELQSGQLAWICEAVTSGCDVEALSAARRTRATRSWRMLLQIDSDDDMGAAFGDAGRLFVFVREVDARRAEFGDTVTIFQTH